MTTIHVYPVDDHVEHVTDGEEGCICGPRVEIVERDQGLAWLVVHHSLDGREAQERPATD